MEIADALMVAIGDHFSSMTHEEVSFEAQRRGIVCTPVLRPEEVLANEHFRSRNSFLQAEFAPGRTGPVAAGFFEIDGERQGYRLRSPTLGEHDSEILQELRSPPRPAPDGPEPPPALPLEGLLVLDFGIGGVGVEAGRLFGEYGADVLKIESRTYPDFMRVVMGTEMSGSFALVEPQQAWLRHQPQARRGPRDRPRADPARRRDHREQLHGHHERSRHRLRDGP